MENVGISGFNNEKPNENPREIKVRLADLGAGKAAFCLLYLQACKIGLTSTQSATQAPERSQP